jgi:fructose-1,6-bisphosphatase/inositol monophosphatase family enzyme
MKTRFAVAQEAVREAGALLRSLFGTDLRVRAKDARTNLVTDADTRAEALIREIIGRTFPDDAVLGEESGKRAHRGRSGRHHICIQR